MPVHNGVDTLERAVASLVGQSLKSLEIVIVDDGSDDGSSDLVDELASRYPQVLPLHMSRNLGVHEARLAGIKVSTAPWIGFMDCDDFARPDMYEVMSNAGEIHDADIVVCGAYWVTAAGRVLRPALRFRKSVTVTTDIFLRFSRFRFGLGMLWNKLYRRELISAYGDMHFPWRQSLNEDLLLNIGPFKDARAVRVLRNMLYCYTKRQASVTATVGREEAVVQTLRAYALAVDAFSNEGSDFLAAITNMYRLQFMRDSLRLEDIDLLASRESDISEAVELIIKSYPAGIAGLITRPPLRPQWLGAFAQVGRKASNALLGQAQP